MTGVGRYRYVLLLAVGLVLFLAALAFSLDELVGVVRAAGVLRDGLSVEVGG